MTVRYRGTMEVVRLNDGTVRYGTVVAGSNDGKVV